MEASELVVVTKADGALLPQARLTQAEHISALKYFRPRSPNWTPPVLRFPLLTCVCVWPWDALPPFRVSAQSGEGLEALWWEGMAAFWSVMGKSGELEARRERQLLAWMHRHLEAELLLRVRRFLHPSFHFPRGLGFQLKHHPEVAKAATGLEGRVREGSLTPGRAAEILLQLFLVRPDTADERNFRKH